MHKQLCMNDLAQPAAYMIGNTVYSSKFKQ